MFEKKLNTLKITFSILNEIFILGIIVTTLFNEISPFQLKK